ncbi:MAG: hypothetical protein WCJ09_24195 [Planctomycetota bacterium]
MSRAFRIHALLVAVFSSISLGNMLFADDKPTPSAEAQSLVEKLTGDDVTLHREAAENLVKLGESAIAPLAEAAEVEDEAVMTRCFDALGRLLASNDPKVAQATQKALTKLSESEIRLVQVRARTTLRLDVLRQNLQKQAPNPLANANRVTRMTHKENGKTTELERAADGSFTGKITETIDGEKKETPIKTASEKELEQKFPEVYEAFQKQQAKQFPFGGIQIGGIPGAPGNQAQIQINGQLFGGIGGLNQTMEVSVVNGKRQIKVQNGDEKVEINDENGKEILLKHTRPVDGKAKTDEYKAADLDDLKKKHPEAAKLYEKHGGANLGAGGGGIQIQVRAAGVGGAPLQFQPRFQVEPVPVPTNRPAGPRTIRAEQDGRKIEITDEDGQKIRVKMTKTIDGKDVSQEFSADDLKTLKAEHPEAAKLYEQLTGRKAE